MLRELRYGSDELVVKFLNHVLEPFGSVVESSPTLITTRPSEPFPVKGLTVRAFSEEESKDEKFSVNDAYMDEKFTENDKLMRKSEADAQPTPGRKRTLSINNTYTRKQRLELLKTLISLFYVDIGNDDWVNSREVQFIIKHCIKVCVMSANSYEEVVNSEVLQVIFQELKKHKAA